MKTKNNTSQKPLIIERVTSEKLTKLQHKLQQAQAQQAETNLQIQLKGNQPHLLVDLALCILYVSRLQKQLQQAQNKYIGKTINPTPKPN